MASNDAQPGTPTDLITSVVNFTDREHHKMWEAMEQKGGWEGWAQVELAFYITNDSATHYVAEREQLIFKKSGQRVDIWATEASSEGLPNIGIELKCESHYQDVTTGTGLQPRLMDDIEKVLGGIKKEFLGKNGARVYVVGITTNPNDLRGYENVARKGVQVRYVQTQSTMHWVLWWYTDFPKA